MKCFVSVFLLLFVVLLPAKAQRPIEITGTVMGERGEPVENAVVSWRYEPEFIFLGGRTYDSYLTMRDGYFGFVTRWKAGKRIRVFIEDPLTRGRYCPVDIRNMNLSDHPGMSGILIPKYKREFSVGNVTRYLRYGIVRIDLDKASMLIDDIKNRRIFLQVRDASGRLLSNETINSAYFETHNWLEICLPVGKWLLSISRGSKGKILKALDVVISSNKITSIGYEK